MFVIIIDYGSGNIKSVYNSVKRTLNSFNEFSEVKVSRNLSEIEKADKIILPGVGSFDQCMNRIRKTKDLVETLKDQVITKKKPFLGICIGMQLMATEGKEKGNHKGLGWIEGKVIKIKKNKKIKIPHMGWNTVKVTSKHPIIKRKKFESYFVHSYNFICKNKKNVLATCDYQQKITAIVGKENIIGTQFHPEKSQKVGLEILKNFISWNY